MGSQPVRLGPFVGGLNNISLAGESRDEELVELVNYELALDTSLITRPPFGVEIATNSFSENWEVLGVYRITAAEWYVIAMQPSSSAGEWFLGAWLNGDLSSTRISIKTVTAVNKVTGFVQYNEWCYFLVNNDAAIKCFRWKNGTAAADINNMPKGISLVSWKDRLWVTGSQTGATGNYVWFSTVDSTGPKPDTWNVSTDFINVDPGSGGLNTALMPLTNSLLIFKEDATYRFGFPNAPKNGEVSAMSRQIGASGPTSVVPHENYSFIYDQGRVYELINSKFTQINLGVDLQSNAGVNVDTTASGVDLSIVNRRLIVRYFSSIFVYSIDTRTWSQWQSIHGTPGQFIQLPGDSNLASPVKYLVATKGLTQSAGSNRIIDSGFIDSKLNSLRTLPDGDGTVSFNNGKMTITPSSTGTVYSNLSSNGQNNDYHIPVSVRQRMIVTVNVTDIAVASPASVEARIRYKLTGGTESIQNLTSQPVAVTGMVTFNAAVVPTDAYAAMLQLGVKGQDSIVTLSQPSMLRESGSKSPANVLSFFDGYENSTPKEFIHSHLLTKAFDYQAAAVFKRLFLWGVDIVTPRSIELKAIPLGRTASVTWVMASAYTWDQLAAGTWNSPLSWKGVTKTITDVTDPFTDISENGRFFVKAPKALRFRQIQFEVNTSTLGNKESGPAKIFTLTTFTKAGQFVTDKAT